MASIYHEKYKGLEEIMRETGSFKRSSAIVKLLHYQRKYQENIQSAIKTQESQIFIG